MNGEAKNTSCVTPRKLKFEQVRADYELFLQTFESKYTINLRISYIFAVLLSLSGLEGCLHLLQFFFYNSYTITVLRIENTQTCNKIHVRQYFQTIPYTTFLFFEILFYPMISLNFRAYLDLSLTSQKTPTFSK